MSPWIIRTVISASVRNSSSLPKPLIDQFISPVLFSTSAAKNIQPKLTVSDYLVKQQHFSLETAAKIPSATTMYVNNPGNADSVINFLSESGFSKSHLENTLRRVPQVLSANLEKNIKPKIKIFQDLGIERSDIADIISADPWVLTRSANNRLGPSLSVLKDVLGSTAGISALLKLSGWFLKNDLESVMMPNIEYLKSCGVTLSQIVKYLYHFPRFFLIKPENMKGFVERVDEMGFDRTTKMFLPAVRTISSMSMVNWNLKLKLFRELGFSEEDILFVFRRTPQVFAISERKIKKVTDVLLGIENVNISDIVCNSWLLIYSVEQRLKPRLAVLKVLESKNLLKKKPSLVTVFKITDARFMQRFVIPYSDELRDLNMTKYSR